MNAATLLLRQVHPTWMQDGVVTSLALKPSKKDSGVLSTYDGSKIDAAAAWRHYTTKMGFRSHGVVGVSVSECEECELKVIADGIPYEEHVGIDFNAHGSSRREKIAKKLQARAATRGWLFQQCGSV